jgi:DNA-binding MarR family transcriptional regulator
VTSWSISDFFLPQRPCNRCRRPSPRPSISSIDSEKLNQRDSSAGSSTNVQMRSTGASTEPSLVTSIILNPFSVCSCRMIVHIVNSSSAEQFEAAYTRIWAALNKPDDPDLSQHERNLLHHIPRRDGVALTWLARHLGLPKSSASVLVKDLERRGFVTRSRDKRDERRLSISLTPKGRRRVASDRVLEPRRLAAALESLPETRVRSVVRAMNDVAAAAEERAAPRRTP